MSLLPTHEQYGLDVTQRHSMCHHTTTSHDHHPSPQCAAHLSTKSSKFSRPYVPKFRVSPEPRPSALDRKRQAIWNFRLTAAVAEVQVALVVAIVWVVGGCPHIDGNMGINANGITSVASAYACGAMVYVPIWMAQYLLDTIVMLKRGEKFQRFCMFWSPGNLRIWTHRTQITVLPVTRQPSRHISSTPSFLPGISVVG
jgi:hypothetical protein